MDYSSESLHSELIKLGHHTLFEDCLTPKRVVVGMSGGVDSSVAALILKAQGHEVIGLFMKNWQEDDPECSAEEDYQDVEAVAAKLGIPYYSLNLSSEYKAQVFDGFVQDYARGLTPNPDILCNREIKFDHFFHQAKELGAEYVATGHYTKTKSGNLYKAHDLSKDQSYFLAAVKGEVLQKVLFPLGELEKKEIRKIAEHFDLATKTKKDSTGICFIGERHFREFLSQYIAIRPGVIRDFDTGEYKGEHQGSAYYTIGQRKGLGVGGPGGPWFVVDKDIEKNEVYIAAGEDHPKLFHTKLTAVDGHFITESWREFFELASQGGDLLGLYRDQRELPAEKVLVATSREDLGVKTRYRQPDQSAKVNVYLAPKANLPKTASESDYQFQLVFELDFAKPVRAIAEGQFVVLYHNDLCLGSALIVSKS